MRSEAPPVSSFIKFQAYEGASIASNLQNRAPSASDLALSPAPYLKYSNRSVRGFKLIFVLKLMINILICT